MNSVTREKVLRESRPEGGIEWFAMRRNFVEW